MAFMKKEHTIIVYQAKTGAIELRKDARKETMWVTLQKVADLFGSERGGQSVFGIVGNVFQTFGGEDVYPSVEV